MSRYNNAAELASELTSSQQEVADLRNALEAAAAVHLRDVALLHDLQPKARAGEPAASMQRPGYASSIPAADRLDFMAAAPAYSGLAAAQPCGPLPFPSDDAMCCSSSATGQEANSSPTSEPGSQAGGAAGGAAAGPPANVEGGQARLAWSSRPLAGGRSGKAIGGGGTTADSNCSNAAAEDLGWKEKYLALFTRTLQLEFKATAWRNEHGRMLRALRSEVRGDADLEAVLSASGGDVNAAAAPWRGRAATIGLLQERLRAAQAAAGQAPASPPSSPSSTTQRLSRRMPALPSAAETRRAEAESLRAELAAAQRAAAEGQAAAQKATTRHTILEAEVKGLRGHLAVLLRKAGNDDRLIAALQAALRTQPSSSSGNSCGGPGGSSAAIADAAGDSGVGAGTSAAASGRRGSNSGRRHSANVLRVSSMSSASGGGAGEAGATRAAMPDAAAAESAPEPQPAEAAGSPAQPAQAAVPEAEDPPAFEPDVADIAMPPDAAADAEAGAARGAAQQRARSPPDSLSAFEAAAHGGANDAAAAGAASVAAPHAGVGNAPAHAPDTTATLAGDASQYAMGAEQTPPAAELSDAPWQPAAVPVSAELANEMQPQSGDAVSEPENAPATADGSSATAAAAEQTAAAVTPDVGGKFSADAEALHGAPAAAAASSLDGTEEVEDAELTADSSNSEHGTAAACSDAFELHAESAEDNNVDSLRPTIDSLQQSSSQDAAGSTAEAGSGFETISSLHQSCR